MAQALAEKFQIGRGALHPTKLDGGLRHAMTLEWPQLGQDVLLGIQKHFISPLHFDAAFETDLGATELIQSVFPDMVPEDVMDLVAALMIWKDECDRSCKRASC